MNLYLTADTIGTETGGGLVTFHESKAFHDFAPCEKWDRSKLDWFQGYPEPWRWDQAAVGGVETLEPERTHIYSGTWMRTVEKIKKQGGLVSITIAAHDVQISREEHEKFCGGFPYQHLTDPTLWKYYIEGYRLADVIVCPGSVPAETVRRYGKDFESKRIEIIPHGCTIPPVVAAMPQRFTVGYLGAIGLDKGLIYLLQAWKRLNYKDALLVIAGKDSTSPAMYSMLQQFGGGAVCLAGWQKNVSDFYNSLSLYVQPSATEGFGIEVLEAMAHARPAICSVNAGAADIAKEANMSIVEARNVDDLARAIDHAKKTWELEKAGVQAREVAKNYTWEKVEQQYINLWESMQ